jgi:hypothetical protein
MREINVAAGAGLPRAFGEATYEDGREDNPEERYRVQLLLSSNSTGVCAVLSTSRS